MSQHFFTKRSGLLTRRVRFSVGKPRVFTLALLLGMTVVGIALMLARPPVSRAAQATTYTVTSTADAGGSCPGTNCTLRQAIATAINGDTINFSLPANSVIDLTSRELAIDKNVKIQGPGANLLSVRRNSSAGNFRIFHIGPTFFVTISGLTITNGATNTGAGVYNDGNLTITDSTIAGNRATGSVGGGIYGASDATTIINCTISGNFGSGGGGISNGLGTMTITNTTISGNTSGSEGGAIFTFRDQFFRGRITITNSTITGNSAPGFGGGIRIDGGDQGTIVTLKNTILAGNTTPRSGPDISGGELISQGYNLIGINDGLSISTPMATDQIGTTASPIEPILGPLQYNGGTTMTHALLAGSPAIDRGDSSGSNTDQRGFIRPVDDPFIGNANDGDGSDTGAYEIQADQLPACNAINKIVNNNNDSGTDSLRAVIGNVCAGSTITFAPNVRGVINLTSDELPISKPLTIAGPGANLLTVQRGASAGNFRIFNLNRNTVIVTISGLTIANGSALSNGGAISNTGTLTIANSTISNNRAGVSGGGIVSSRTLNIFNSTISGNSANDGFGGGIYSTGVLNIDNSTISGNSASLSGFAIGSGGGIQNGGGTVTITNSTISRNTAQFRGGGVMSPSGTLTSRNTIIALNTAPTEGPDVFGVMGSQGFNLIGNSAGMTMVPVRPSDQIGTPSAPIDPRLGPLQDNGGRTSTLALLSGSGAIDKGNSGGSITDQREFARPVGSANVTGGDGSDIGAFEVQTTSTPTPTPTPTPAPNVVQFSASNYSTSEDCTAVSITVNRIGDTSSAASVDYATSDVTASERRDYTTALGKLRFATGETAKSFTVLINEDSYVEGPESFNVTLSNPSGASLGVAVASVQINDDPTEPTSNSIDDAATFVGEHYHDFLNRQGDASGLAFWTDQITSCGTDQACIQLKRVNVSAAYFLSIEFQQTGYLVERIYKTAYGNGSGTSTFGGTHQLPVPIVRFQEFLRDTQQIGQGVVVGQAGWETALENNKQAFTADFVQLSRFTTAFPSAMTAAQFVDALNANAGNPLSVTERNQLVNDLSINAKTRAQVLRSIAEHPTLVSTESNRAFVLMQYFGYLRRNPNDPQDSDYTGYDFWLTKLNQFSGNFVNAEMVKAFITSTEYRSRFGPP